MNTNRFSKLLVILLAMSVIIAACASPTPSATTAAAPTVQAAAVPQPTATVAPAAVNVTPAWVAPPGDWQWTGARTCWSQIYIGGDGVAYCRGLGLVVALPSVLPLQNWPPIDESVYSETDKTNINIVYKWSLGGRYFTDEINGQEVANVDFPLWRKCNGMLLNPRGYFSIPWELYQRIGNWCHAEASLLDYLYRVSWRYAFVNWHTDSKTVDALFLTEQWTLPVVNATTSLECGEKVDLHGTTINITPLPNSPVYSLLTVVKNGETLMDWEIYYKKTDVLVFVLGSSLNDDVVVETQNTQYQYIPVYPCPEH